MSILGLNWCQHAGWMLVLYDTASRRRLQITLRLEDALVVGEELAGKPTERTRWYTLVGGLLRQQPHAASVNLILAEENRAGASLVLHGEDDHIAYPTSAGDGVALAVRAELPIFADEALLETFGVGEQPEPSRSGDDAHDPIPIPDAFRLALDEPMEHD